jgi:hypothetical protein
MNTKKFNNADDLVKYCIENNLLAGQVWVDHNPYGGGERTLLFFYINHDKELSTDIYMQDEIATIDYAYARNNWHQGYVGTFELVLLLLNK